MSIRQTLSNLEDSIAEIINFKEETDDRYRSTPNILTALAEFHEHKLSALISNLEKIAEELIEYVEEKEIDPA